MKAAKKLQDQMRRERLAKKAHRPATSAQSSRRSSKRTRAAKPTQRPKPSSPKPDTWPQAS
jgi:hypothetical protein